MNLFDGVLKFKGTWRSYQQRVLDRADRYLTDGSILHSVNYPDCPLSAAFRHRLCVLHANVPNMVGQISAMIAEKRINIDSMVNKSRGPFAYTVLDLDEAAADDVLAGIAALNDVYRVRNL